MVMFSKKYEITQTDGTTLNLQGLDFTVVDSETYTSFTECLFEGEDIPRLIPTKDLKWMQE